MSEKVRDEVFNKIREGLKSKYINDLKIMEDFNHADPLDKDKIIEYFFNEMVRLFSELKMGHTEVDAFRTASIRLNHYLVRSVVALSFNYDWAMETRRGLIDERY